MFLILSNLRLAIFGRTTGIIIRGAALFPSKVDSQTGLSVSEKSFVLGPALLLSRIGLEQSARSCFNRFSLTRRHKRGPNWRLSHKQVQSDLIFLDPF